MYMVNATSLAVEQSSFVNNTALTGGGIYLSDVTDTYIYETYFYSNNVTQEGGAIYSGMPSHSDLLRMTSSVHSHTLQSTPLFQLTTSTDMMGVQGPLNVSHIQLVIVSDCTCGACSYRSALLHAAHEANMKLRHFHSCSSVACI